MKSKVKYAAMFVAGVLGVMWLYKKFAPVSVQAKLGL